MCHQTPLLEVVLPDNRSFLYARVQPEDAKAIVLRHFRIPRLGRRISHAVSQTLETVLKGDKAEPVTHYSIDVRDKPVADFLGKQKPLNTAALSTPPTSTNTCSVVALPPSKKLLPD